MPGAGPIKVIGRSVKVVDHDGLIIEETIGNVATKNDELSLATVTITKPTSEPWLTLRYDEWMHVLEGYIEIHQEDDGSESVVRVDAGETAFIPEGSRMRPVFPVPSRYMPVCLPAFSPERCTREEGAEPSSVSARLGELHAGAGAGPGLSAGEINAAFDDVARVYHMCQSSAYERAVASEAAYFPPTFVRDGRFTHATAVPADLITTANHFYTGTVGEWICIELDRQVLEKKLGIVTLFESAKPVGHIGIENDGWKNDVNDVYPHIFGGIPVCVDGVVTNVYKMKRSGDGMFLSIDGLVDR